MFDVVWLDRLPEGAGSETLHHSINVDLRCVCLVTEQQAALDALRGVQADIEEIRADPSPSLPPEQQSFIERFNSMVDDTLAAVDPRDSLEQLSNRVADASEHIISLIVIFVLQTICLPVGFVWLFVELLKGIGQRLTGRV